MALDGTDNDQTLDGTPDPVEAAITAASAPAGGLTPEQVHATPEYKAMARQLRAAQRERGQFEREATAARTDAENARLAAEANEREAREREIASILGPEGVEAWQRIADLSVNDQVAAAKELAALMKRQAQSPTPGEAPAAPAAGGEPVAAQQSAAPSTLDASAPLSPAVSGDEVAREIAERETALAAFVERNRDPVQRNRITGRERADAILSYVRTAYLRATGQA